MGVAATPITISTSNLPPERIPPLQQDTAGVCAAKAPERPSRHCPRRYRGAKGHVLVPGIPARLPSSPQRCGPVRLGRFALPPLPGDHPVDLRHAPTRGALVSAAESR